jgi:starch synthase
VTRMTPQKGFDLLAQGIEELMSLDMQLVILGSGDPAVEEIFKQAQSRSGGKLRVILGFDNALAHKIQAGSDMFLMPSRFEPCGLTQMYALKYGTAPVVRATGGLADTVSEFDPRSGKGNGFVFHQYRHEDLLATLARAIAVYRQPSAWRRLRENGFAADFSWTRAADRYLEVFARLYAERVG